ncbi:putative membrane protein [Mucilaginibacter frigoritolerans]|uniref:Putative membrane protein n=1 Tax=Mucilaginibacter frigoritolerans TaxID=652788 RepID=A0A562U833_9SPHI|nr:heparan-alpha-glucosaminide N-acetyltransferase domain-containing protein [Mucilaginibacter frigoritolerans]TWJ01565.1 putative membrane protein [Mucilaginibacter frigoritolerans]
MATDAQLLVKKRISSIDILRGAIMLIMALDHVRDFFHHVGPNSDPTDMATTTPILFFTRWITHFCAPTFVFLSGVSAHLAGIKRTKSELSAFLIKRGLWLVFVEVVILTFAFSLNPFYNVFILQVLWAIGLSMILLGLVVRAPLTVIAVLGGLIFFCHDILDYVTFPKSGVAANLDNLFLVARGSVIPLGGNRFAFDLYAIIPWTGVMFLGYVFGKLYTPAFTQQKRKKILLYTGIGALALFLVLRIINKYGDPNPWAIQRDGVYTVLSFFNVSKYPPSLLYSFMTIGTSLVILSLIENVQNKFTNILIIYGNVPFFYYVLHFYLIRSLDVILFFASGYHTDQILSKDSPFLFKPADMGFNLGGVYLVWLLVIVILYFPCRWFSKYKKTHHQWWLSYL